QAEDGIRDFHVTGVQTCALPILKLDAIAFPDRTGTLASIASVLESGVVPRGFSSGEDNLGSLALVQAATLSASRGGDWVDIAEGIGSASGRERAGRRGRAASDVA